MNNPLHAAYYADQAVNMTVPIVENVRIARDTFRTRFTCPEMAARITPGQFFMVRLSGCDDPLIGRPFALYEAEAGSIDFVYVVGGKLTGRLAGMTAGRMLDVWGPLGNGFQTPPADHLIMVAGGIGQTPFLALGQQALGRRTYGRSDVPFTSHPHVMLLYGARSADLLAGVGDFRQAGMDVRVATDDGSEGHHGLVTDLLKSVLDEDTNSSHVVCCGPEPMMEAVAKVAAEQGVSCQVSLEAPMACGIGICYTCVAKVRDADGNWDYQRTCVDGPVFDATLIQWD